MPRAPTHEQLQTRVVDVVEFGHIDMQVKRLWHAFQLGSHVENGRVGHSYGYTNITGNELDAEDVT